MSTPTPRRRPAPDAPRIHICHASDCLTAHYVGRDWAGRKASPLGNPFKGDGAIERFRRWLLDAFAVVYGNGRPTAAQADAVHAVLDLADAFREAGTLDLACWCSPGPCHADVIAKAVMFVVKRDPQYIKAGGAWLRVEYDPEFDTEFALPFVAYRDGVAVRACATLAQARRPLAKLRPNAAERINGAGIREDDELPVGVGAGSDWRTA